MTKQQTLDDIGREIEATLWASSGMLVGWAAIASYVKKAPRTLRRYRQLMGFPAIRFGRHVVTDPALIRSWLLVAASGKRNIGRGQECARK